MEVQTSPYHQRHPQGVGRAWPLSALLPGVCTALGPLTSPLLFVAGLLTKCKARRVAAWKLYVFVAISLIEFLVLISIISVRSQVVSGLIPAAPAAGRGEKKRGLGACIQPCCCPFFAPANLWISLSLGLSQRACSCPPSWIGFKGKCFYFSDGEKNQTLSRADCHARNASLAVIQSREELVRLGLFSFFILGGGQSSGGVGEPPFQPCSPSAPRTS